MDPGVARGGREHRSDRRLAALARHVLGRACRLRCSRRVLPARSEPVPTSSASHDGKARRRELSASALAARVHRLARRPGADVPDPAAWAGPCRVERSTPLQGGLAPGPEQRLTGGPAPPSTLWRTSAAGARRGRLGGSGQRHADRGDVPAVRTVHVDAVRRRGRCRTGTDHERRSTRGKKCADRHETSQHVCSPVLAPPAGTANRSRSNRRRPLRARRTSLARASAS